MRQIGRLAALVVAAVAMLVVGLGSTPAAAHGAHAARAAIQISYSIPADTEVAAADRARDARVEDGCVIDCCLGSATCIAHVAGPPVSAPVLPDPGSIRLGPLPEPDLSGIVGERLPRPPRAA